MSCEESKPKLLLIDDSVDVHRLLTARLKHEPVEVVGVASGPEAFEWLKNTLPGAILLDLDMPVMDGFEVLRSLKEDSNLSNIPVVVLSGLAGSEDKVAAIKPGSEVAVRVWASGTALAGKVREVAASADPAVFDASTTPIES